MEKPESAGRGEKLPANKSILHFLSRNLNVKLALRCKNAALPERKRGGERETDIRESEFRELVIHFPASSLH